MCGGDRHLRVEMSYWAGPLKQDNCHTIRHVRTAAMLQLLSSRVERRHTIKRDFRDSTTVMVRAAETN